MHFLLESVQKLQLIAIPVFSHGQRFSVTLKSTSDIKLDIVSREQSFFATTLATVPSFIHHDDVRDDFIRIKSDLVRFRRLIIIKSYCSQSQSIIAAAVTFSSEVTGCSFVAALITLAGCTLASGTCFVRSAPSSSTSHSSSASSCSTGRELDSDISSRFTSSTLTAPSSTTFFVSIFLTLSPFWQFRS